MEKDNGYLDAAGVVYKKFLNSMRNVDPNNSNISTCCWTYGTVIDTMFDYLQLAAEYDQTLIDFAKKTFYYTGSWYDDFMWPAIASLKAFDSNYDNVFSNEKPFFQALVIQFWNKIYNGIVDNDKTHLFGTLNVWEKCDKSKFSQYKPKFSGGAWQCDIYAKKDPGKENLGPFQDSVINDLLLVYATRLSSLDLNMYPGYATQINQAKEASKNLLGFLKEWFGFGEDTSLTGDTILLHYCAPGAYPGNFDNGILVRERISKYHDIFNSRTKDVNYFSPMTWWTGDQGMMMGGLIDHDDFFKSVAIGILKGVMAEQVCSAPGYYYIKSRSDKWLVGADDCYSAGGGGIFMRYLLYMLKTKNKETVNLINSAAYKNKIQELANAAKNSANDMDPDQEYSEDNIPDFKKLDRLSVLTTAAYCEKYIWS